MKIKTLLKKINSDKPIYIRYTDKTLKIISWYNKCAKCWFFMNDINILEPLSDDILNLKVKKIDFLFDCIIFKVG